MVAAVAPVLDVDRVVTYSPVTYTESFNITFPLFGDNTDIEVWLNGAKLSEPTYSVLSPSGTLSLLVRPVTDAYVKFPTGTGISSGSLVIMGKERPRRATQATSALTTRDFNLSFSDVVAMLRELFTANKRAIKSPPGETTDLLLPSSTSRASLLMGFDSTGAPTTYPLSTSLLSSAISWVQSGSGAVGRTVESKLRDIVCVFDFMTAAEISDVTSRTASIDVSTKINNAIAQVPFGTRILCPTGGYRLLNSIVLNRGVTLVGEGTISTLQPNTRYGTEFKWYGGVAQIVSLGGFGTVYTGGGLWNIGLVGNSGASIANYGIYTKDIQGFDLRNVNITSCSVAGMLFTNTAGQDPTGFGLLENIRIQLRGGATNSATGILIDGVGTGTDGVTISRAINVRIEHANGAGVEVRAIGDAWTWIGLKTFRADVETGIGVWFSTASTTSVCGFHTFLHPIVTAGFRFDTPGQHIGTQIINADQIDMNTSTNTLYGTGCQDVMMNTQTGAQYGLSVLTPSLFTSPEHDTMRYIRYDSANNIVFTHMMAWRTILTGTPTIVAGGGAGGALSLYTGAVIGNRTTIADVDALNADGWCDLQYPIAQCMVYFVTGSNVIYRIGWMDGVGATPTNGCYIELDPSVNSGNFQLVTRKAGVETRVNASVGASAYLDLKFQFQVNQFVVFYRTSGNKNHARLAISTTNVPTVNMGWAYSVETKAASAARLDIYAHRVGGINEQMFL